MARDFFERLLKGVSLVPLKYYLGGALCVVALLSYAVYRTFTAPTVVFSQQASAGKSTIQSLIQPRQPASVPPTVWEENVFRRQRKNFAPPPPPPPPPQVAQVPAQEPVPAIKLLGLILTDSRKMAIVDAELKRYIRKEIPESLVVSGMKQAPLSDDGRYYETIAVKGDKLAAQTFNEGDIISDFRLERVNVDSIEVSSLASGRRTLVPLEEADNVEKSLEKRLSKEKPMLLRDVPNTGLSGAKQ